MRVLLIKMSSMGDVFHTFPALTDAQQKVPGLVVDWVVEKGFAEIPAWHPVVNQIHAIELRKWRKHPVKYRKEIKAFFQQLNQHSYDLVIDAQGLLKSVWVVKKVCSGQSVGLSWQTVREPLASLFYDQKISVSKNQHAIARLRQLFAKALNYQFDPASVNYGLHTDAWQPLPSVSMQFSKQSYVVCLHGTTWQTKYWPENYWVALLDRLAENSIPVVLPWGTEEERQRSLRIISKTKNHQAWCPEQKLALNEMARLLKFAKMIVSVDTGLSHVAAALDVNTLVLYRVTDPEKVGATGQKVQYLQSPLAKAYLKNFKDEDQEKHSLEGLSVADVFNRMQAMMGAE